MSQEAPQLPGPGEHDAGAVRDRRPPQAGPQAGPPSSVPPQFGPSPYGPTPSASVPFGPPRPGPPPFGPQPVGSGPHPVPHPVARPVPPPGMPRQAPPGYGHGYPPPTGGWAPIVDDVEDPATPGNPAAAFSLVLGVLALLVGLRPLAFGSMALSWDGFLGLAIALVGVVAGAVGLRAPVRRPLAVVGMVLGVAALLVVATLPTF
jgi:hypothetical protein